MELKALTIKGNITAAGLSHIVPLQLRELTISNKGAQLNESYVDVFGKMASLQKLDIRGMHDSPDDYFKDHLKTLNPHLKIAYEEQWCRSGGWTSEYYNAHRFIASSVDPNTGLRTEKQ